MNAKILAPAVGLLTFLAASPLALGTPPADGGAADSLDLRALAAGDVVSRGALVDGRCEFPAMRSHASVSALAPFFAFETIVTEDCALVVASTCDNPALCPGMAVPNAVGDARVEWPMTHCTARNRAKADYWTEGYPGAAWDGVKTDILTETFVDMTWDHNCSDGKPVVVAIGEDCIVDGPDWHEHWCTRPSWCSSDATSNCWELRGEYECHYTWNVFCSGSTYLHQVYAAVRGRNDGTATCYYQHSGTLPPRVDGKCSYLSP